MQRVYRQFCLRAVSQRRVSVWAPSKNYSTGQTRAWVLTDGGIESTLSGLAIGRRLDPDCKVKTLIGGKGKNK